MRGAAIWFLVPPKTGNLCIRILLPSSDSSLSESAPFEAAGLRNGSLFKSFMNTPQKRKACRKLWDCNEEGVIAPLICDDLRHNACDWFDNQALFPFRRGRTVKSAIPTGFPFFFPSLVFTDKCLSFSSSYASMDFFSLFTPHIPPSRLTHPINILLNSQIQQKNSPHYYLHCVLPGIWWEGNLLIQQTCSKAERHAGNCKWENTRWRESVLGKPVCSQPH